MFVLREVFDVPYDEIAEAVGKGPAAVRQVAHRAREHVAARRPRMQVDRTEQEQVVERFMAAVTTGDVQGLMDVLAPDVVLVADGGGMARAVRRARPRRQEGGEPAAAFSSVSRNPAIAPSWVNGASARGSTDEVDGTTIVSLVVEEGRITRIFSMRNPDKLDGAGPSGRASR